MTGINDPFVDPVQEWFPVLAKRASVTTIQGREWSLGGDFLTFHDAVRNLQNCLNAEPACVENWAMTQNISYDYLYLLKTPVSLDVAKAQIPSLLIHLLRSSPAYEVVYESLDVVIFSVDGAE